MIDKKTTRKLALREIENRGRELEGLIEKSLRLDYEKAVEAHEKRELKLFVAGKLSWGDIESNSNADEARKARLKSKHLPDLAVYREYVSGRRVDRHRNVPRSQLAAMLNSRGAELRDIALALYVSEDTARRYLRAEKQRHDHQAEAA